MKAITFTQYGGPDVLQIRDVETPIPTDDQMLIRVHAASINATDQLAMRGKPWLLRLASGLRKPKRNRLGYDVAGTVEAVGANVTQWQVGDRVYGAGANSLAEFVAANPSYVVRMPDDLSFEDAAAIPLAALTAWQGIAKAGGIQAGDEVLITGASGGVGSLAVQLAKAMGATVTGVCRGSKTEFVRSLGADHVIDYQNEDFTDNKERYRMLLDCASYRPLWEVLPALRPDGAYVLIGGAFVAVLQLLVLRRWLTRNNERTVQFFIAQTRGEDFAAINQYVQSGQVKAPIDRVFPLAEIAAAMRHFEGGELRGKVVVAMSSEVESQN